MYLRILFAFMACQFTGCEEPVPNWARHTHMCNIHLSAEIRRATHYCHCINTVNQHCASLQTDWKPLDAKELLIGAGYPDMNIYNWHTNGYCAACNRRLELQRLEREKAELQTRKRALAETSLERVMDYANSIRIVKKTESALAQLTENIEHVIKKEQEIDAKMRPLQRPRINPPAPANAKNTN